jgi:predicted ATP-dependent endonuclease of OLD family
LVEGPSDELIVNYAHLLKYHVLPIEYGRDVISVKGLSFKRYLEIAEKLELPMTIITDNDGDLEALERKYEHYKKIDWLTISYDDDIGYPTLEPQIVKINSLEVLNELFERTFENKDEAIEWMTASGNKTECALKILESDRKIQVPDYIIKVI